MMRQNKKLTNKEDSKKINKDEDDKLILSDYTFKKKLSSCTATPTTTTLPNQQKNKIQAIQKSCVLQNDKNKVLKSSDIWKPQPSKNKLILNQTASLNNPLIKQNIFLKSNKIQAEEKKIQNSHQDDQSLFDQKENLINHCDLKPLPKKKNTAFQKATNNMYKDVKKKHVELKKQRSQNIFQNEEKTKQQTEKPKQLLNKNFIQKEKKPSKIFSFDDLDDDEIILQKKDNFSKKSSLFEDNSFSRDFLEQDYSQTFEEEDDINQLSCNKSQNQSIISEIKPFTELQEEISNMKEQNKEKIKEFDRLIDEQQVQITIQNKRFIENEEKTKRQIMNENDLSKLISYLRQEQMNSTYIQLVFQRICLLFIKQKNHILDYKELTTSNNVLTIYHNPIVNLKLPPYSNFTITSKDPRRVSESQQLQFQQQPQSYLSINI